MLYTYDDTLQKVKYFENCRVHAGTGYLVVFYLGTWVVTYRYFNITILYKLKRAITE